MKKSTKQKERIIDNLFDILCQTQFEGEARKQMKKDLKNKNISVNKNSFCITIEDKTGLLVQYTLSIQ